MVVHDVTVVPLGIRARFGPLGRRIRADYLLVRRHGKSSTPYPVSRPSHPLEGGVTGHGERGVSQEVGVRYVGQRGADFIGFFGAV